MTMTPTLMTAADMRTFLIEKRAADERMAQAKETERLKRWSNSVVATMLETIMKGHREDSKRCNSHADALAIVNLAQSLGYEAEVSVPSDDPDDDSFYAVVKAPELEVAS